MTSPGPLPEPTHVLLAGFAEAAAAALGKRVDALAGDAVAMRVAVSVAQGADETLELLAGGEVAVLGLGPLLAGATARDLLERAVAARPEDTALHLVFAAGDALELFQELVDRGQVDYLSAKPPTDDDMALLLVSAARRVGARLAGSTTAVPEGDAFTRGLLSQVRQLAATKSPGTATRSVAQTLLRSFEVDYASCRLFDPDSDTLWCEEKNGEERRDSAASGVTSFVLRTGALLRLERVGDDPRYDSEADNPGGGADRRYLAVPVPGRETPVVAVLVLLRDGAAEPFSDDETERLERGARLLAGVLEQQVLERRIDAARPRIFRQQALEHHHGGDGGQGRVLALSPAWLDHAYTLLMAVLVVALLYTVFARFHEYAAGPAAVSFEGLHEVTARLSGSALSVEVAVGERVRAGQLLATFYDHREAAERDRLESELEASLLDRLLDPEDSTTERTLGALRAQLELAESRLEERSLRSPNDGVVSDLRLRPGQQVEPGQVVATLTDAAPEHSILALLPGHYRPQLRPGMPLRLELEGYPYAYQHLEIERVGEEVLGPAEARRVLDPDIADALPFSGSVVLVHARLPVDHFTSDDRVYHFHDGMLGTAEVRIRSERLLLVLVPGLEALFHRRHAEVEEVP